MLENIKTERNTIMSLGYLVREYSTKSWIDDVNKLLGKGNHTLNTVFNVAIQYLADRQNKSILGREIITNHHTKYALAYTLMSSIIQSFGINEYSISEFRMRFRKIANVVHPKDKPNQTKFVEESVFTKILNALELRPRLFLLVFILSGARGMSNVNIKLDDIVYKDDIAYFTIDEKGNKQSQCSLPVWLVEEIKTNLKPKKYLIETETKHKYTRNNLNIYMKSHIEPLLGRRWHNHMARHSFATNNLKRGVTIVAIKERLGHASISTTMKYLHDDFKPDQLLSYSAAIMPNKNPEGKDAEIIPPKPKKLTKYEIVAGQVTEATTTIQEAQETVKSQRSLIDLIDRKRSQSS